MSKAGASATAPMARAKLVARAVALVGAEGLAAKSGLRATAVASFATGAPLAGEGIDRLVAEAERVLGPPARPRRRG